MIIRNAVPSLPKTLLHNSLVATVSMESPLKIEGVSKRFQLQQRTIQALNDVSFEIPAGKVTGLIGADAAGKTTLMRLIAGLLTFEKGRIEVLGKDVQKSPLEIQSQIGYMPQQFGLYQDLTVLENLNLYADLQNLASQQRANTFDELLDMTGMSPFRTRLAGKLSGGMKQKLGLACTLLKSPDLLLLDEPTVGVDPVSRRELWHIVYQAVEQNGMSVLLSTAYLDEAERCHDIKLLHEGQLLSEGSPQQFTQPLKQRTFLVSSSNDQCSRRQLKKQLAAQDKVQDALIYGEAVRVLVKKPVNANQTLWEDMKGHSCGDNLKIEPVEARFEDAFVDLLSRSDDGAEPESEALALKVTSFDSAPKMSSKEPRKASQNSPKTNSSNDASQTAIEVENLVKRFGEFVAVDHLSFKVGKGEIFGLLGANGAGKTTTFRMLCGLLEATEGHLQVAGHNLRHSRARARASLGYMSQKFSLYGVMTTQQNLAFYSKVYGLNTSQRKARMDWAIDVFELSQVLNQPSRDLPLGFKQRLAMACALMHEPQILFLDEPTSGVDPMGRRDFWNKINTLAEQGVTVMVTTHFMEEAEYCDRMAIMAQGRILALGTPEEIKSQAKETSMEDAFIQIIQADKSDASTENKALSPSKEQQEGMS